MAIKYHQISLNEVFSDCQTKLIEEAPSFFQLLSEHFDLDTFISQQIPCSFFLSGSARNFGTSVASQKFLMLLS